MPWGAEEEALQNELRQQALLGRQRMLERMQEMFPKPQLPLWWPEISEPTTTYREKVLSLIGQLPQFPPAPVQPRPVMLPPDLMPGEEPRWPLPGFRQQEVMPVRFANWEGGQLDRGAKAAEDADRILRYQQYRERRKATEDARRMNRYLRAATGRRYISPMEWMFIQHASGRVKPDPDYYLPIWGPAAYQAGTERILGMGALDVDRYKAGTDRLVQGLQAGTQADLADLQYRRALAELATSERLGLAGHKVGLASALFGVPHVSQLPPPPSPQIPGEALMGSAADAFLGRLLMQEWWKTLPEEERQRLAAGLLGRGMMGGAR